MVSQDKVERPACVKQSIELMFGEMCSVTIEGEGSGGDVVEHDVRSPASHQVEPGTYEEEVKEVHNSSTFSPDGESLPLLVRIGVLLGAGAHLHEGKVVWPSENDSPTR